MSDSFPRGLAYEDQPKNPAIQLFGNRLFSDQTPTEFLVEFFLVAFAPKRIGADSETLFDEPLPSFESLLVWPEGAHLQYAPKADPAEREFAKNRDFPRFFQHFGIPGHVHSTPISPSFSAKSEQKVNCVFQDSSILIVSPWSQSISKWSPYTGDR